MKIYDRILSKVEIPVGIEIELEADEELYFKYRPLFNTEDNWIPASAAMFRVVRESK
jgi:hypothetical protein